VSDPRESLLRVGATEWDAINRAETRERVEWARERTVAELVAVGIVLSRTAHEILSTVRPAYGAGAA